MEMDRDTPVWAQNAWRWRLFVLRAIIDHERQSHGGDVNERCADCFEELRALYHADEGRTRTTCCPPTRRLILDKK